MLKYSTQHTNIFGKKSFYPDKQKKYAEIHDMKLIIKRAPEPSDIIWENLQITKK